MGNSQSGTHNTYAPQAQPNWNMNNGLGSWAGDAAGAAVGQKLGGPAGGFIGAKVGQSIGGVADVAIDQQGRQTQMDYQHALGQGMSSDNAARYAVNVNNLQ